MKDFLSFKKVGKNGYLMVPRNLLEEVFSVDKPFTEAQAYLYLYMKASFCNRKGKRPLKRGQLTFTASALAKRFKWKVYTLREFLHTLHKEGGDCPGTDAGSGTESDDVLLRGAGNRTRETDKRVGTGGFQ